MIAFFSALKEEREAVRRSWGIAPAGSMRGLELEAGVGIVHFTSGMGEERMARAVKLAQKTFEPHLYVLVGFSVGLDDKLRVGDLVCDERSSPLLSEGKCAYRTGRVATCGFLNTASQKRAFAQKHPGCLAADLETEAFLKAVPSNVEVVVLRVVSDTIDSDLPLNFGDFATELGFPDVRAIGLKVATRPHLLPKLLKLGREAGRAVESLADLLTEQRGAMESHQRLVRP